MCMCAAVTYCWGHCYAERCCCYGQHSIVSILFVKKSFVVTIILFYKQLSILVVILFNVMIFTWVCIVLIQHIRGVTTQKEDSVNRKPSCVA